MVHLSCGVKLMAWHLVPGIKDRVTASITRSDSEIQQSPEHSPGDALPTVSVLGRVTSTFRYSSVQKCVDVQFELKIMARANGREDIAEGQRSRPGWSPIVPRRGSTFHTRSSAPESSQEPGSCGKSKCLGKSAQLSCSRESQGSRGLQKPEI